jgi:hypothetical protein
MPNGITVTGALLGFSSVTSSERRENVMMMSMLISVRSAPLFINGTQAEAVSYGMQQAGWTLIAGTVSPRTLSQEVLGIVVIDVVIKRSIRALSPISSWAAWNLKSCGRRTVSRDWLGKPVTDIGEHRGMVPRQMQRC